MARTASNMIPLGFEAPEFELLNVMTSTKESLANLRGKQGTLIMFICNHCPFVIHLHKGFQELFNDYEASGINIIAISSNDVINYPEDGPEQMKELFSSKRFNIPYLYDETQMTAKAYDAACTPDFYLFDENLKCSYRGQFDDSRPNNRLLVTGLDLRVAMNALLEGNSAPQHQTPSLGCNIKWK